MLKPHKILFRTLLIVVWTIAGFNLHAQERIPITVDKKVIGAPMTMGIPFAQGTLMSPDHVRLLDSKGQEIPCQTTMVTNWEPVDFSVKWLWVFFFSNGDEDYILEHGPNVRKAPIEGDQIKIKNAQRIGQTSYIETGPLRFAVSKREGGFIDNVLFDTEGNGFDENDTIAVTNGARGSFLDILDDLGMDKSKATIHRTVRERGSGPLHAILRMEGDYKYGRDDNRDSPFTIRVHAYAGKSYIRVFHTITYTGVPDKHKPVPGEHANIALDADSEIKDESESTDEGWMQPNDRIASTGLSLVYNLGSDLKYMAGYRDASWSEMGESKVFTKNLGEANAASIFQTGPKPDRIPPVPNSDMETRIDGFAAQINMGEMVAQKMERAEGWADLSDDKWGVSIGIKNFLEEYPKEIHFDKEKNIATAYCWSPQADPMSFARASLKRDQGMVSNFAEGVTKTSEVVFYFHTSKSSGNESEVKGTVDYFLDPPVPHASAETYSKSKVYGQFAPRSDKHADLERSLDYKFDWQIFNQHWEPWYGMFDYGDQKNMFFREDWFRWQNNEPAIDFMYWLQFMRTGDSKYYHTAEAMSRHTMDVDNIHWPTNPPYYGDTNESLDWYNHEARESTASPYLGIGRRHANQHWAATLSAHVWLEGWIASYYLTGYHRGLDIARLTADSHVRRVWGDHGLTGRRLYVSIWNMVEAWDATKDPVYFEDLKDRVDRAINFQNGRDQYDNLAIDRYGYSQVYASHGLYKYYQLTGDEKVKQSLIRHARAVRDNPPYNHEYESLLATIHSLVLGYEFTGEKSFLMEAKKRSEVMKTGKLTQSFEELGTQKNILEALSNLSNLPNKGDFASRARFTNNWDPAHGLRVFGWTHIYNVPWLIGALERAK